MTEPAIAGRKPAVRLFIRADVRHSYRMLRGRLNARSQVNNPNKLVLNFGLDLPQIAHVEPLPARREFHVVVGLCPSDAVDVPTRFRHLQRL